LKILVFEFATALGLDDPSIAAEGLAMLNGLLGDLKDQKVHYLISKGKQIKNLDKHQPIFIKNHLFDWIDKNIANYDACLPIAPEDDFILYKIIKTLEENRVKVIGSNSDAVMTCSDKFKTYETLKNKLPFIKTDRVLFDDLGDFNVRNKYETLFKDDKKRIVKPAAGVSCSGVEIVNSFKEFRKASLNVKTHLPYFLLQDFIEGIASSVSLVSNGKNAIPLSLNFQNIHISNNKFNYNGGFLPLEHELSEDAKKIAKKAVESIDGLKGYVGVDLILGEVVHLVEINSRITTPYIALRKIINFNLGEAIIDSVDGELPDNVSLKGKISFEKKDSYLEINEVVQ